MLTRILNETMCGFGPKSSSDTAERNKICELGAKILTVAARRIKYNY